MKKITPIIESLFRLRRGIFFAPCSILVGILFLVNINNVSAQCRYRVYFTNKNTEFNPAEYFDIKAINRRLKNELYLSDSTDFPVNTTYINSVISLGDSTGIVSRWFNFMAVYTDDVRAEKIKQFPFVSRVEKMEPKYPFVIKPAAANYSSPGDSLLHPESIKLLKQQIDMMQGHEFSSREINGKGVRIAIFDAGFPNADVANVFTAINKQHRIVATYNFGRKCEYVYGYNPHGTMVMGCIGGKLSGRNIGLATGAEFMLAITENASFEAYKEEENWLAAAEWADRNGADIINSSLGYTNDLYFTDDMNGRKSLIGRAATMAVKKGILVVSAAGNEGDGKWEIVASPGDVDSVLTVGAIDPKSGLHASYSSFGPNRDMRLKPNVSAAGTVLSYDKNRLGVASGTSFASPLVAGFAACVLQMDTTLKVYELYQKIEQAGSLYPYYDYAHGYGIPQASYFLSEIPKTGPTFKLLNENGKLTVKLDSIYLMAASEQSEKLVYYHIENPKGVLEKYYVVLANNTTPVEIALDAVLPKSIIRVHYRGYTAEFTKPE